MSDGALKWGHVRSFFLTVILAAAFIFPCSPNAEPIVIHPENQFAYGKSLFETGDYISAMVEFKRFIHFFPEDSRVPEARYYTGLSWMNGGKYQEALQVFEDILSLVPADPFAVEACFMAVKCHERNGNPALGAVELQNLIRSAKDDTVKNRAVCTLGFLYLESGSWNRAREAFEKVSPEGRTACPVSAVLEHLEKTGDIPRKNPVAAGILSVVPGGGFLYCGRPRDALVSFLVNGGLIYSAVRSFRREDYALGGVVSFVGFGFYAGNIYGSVSSAHKYNRAQDRRFVRELKEKLPVSLGLFSVHGLGRGLACRWKF